MSAKIGIVVLNWNGIADTLECIESLRSQNFPLNQLKIIVVDNGSTDNSAESLRTIEDIYLLLLPKNRGFAVGNNAGIQYALDIGCEYVMVLNNDVTVATDFLVYMLDLMEASPFRGIVTPKIYYFDTPDILWYNGGRFRYPRIIGEMMGQNEKDNPTYDHEAQVDFAVGCCMLIRRDVIELIGYFDENFFAYEEDVDFSIRAKQAGYEIWVQPKSHIWHKVSRATRNSSSMRLFLQAQSRMIFFSKHIPAKDIPYVILLEFARLIRVVGNELISFRAVNATSYIRGIVSGMKIAISIQNEKSQRVLP